MRIVDLETKSYSRNPRSSSAATIRRLESQVEELTNQLGQVMKEHRRTSLSRDGDSKQHEGERQRMKEEIRFFEEKVEAMRKQMDLMVCSFRVEGFGFRIIDAGSSKWMRTTFNWRNAAQNVRLQSLGRNL